MIAPLRVVLDVNIFVPVVMARSEGRTGTAAQRIFSALQVGFACGRPAQIIVSHRMIDTLAGVLQRLSVSERTADEVAGAIVNAAKKGPEGLEPHLILGGTPDLTLRDTEDGDVLATAFAARAHVLVTDNLSDFATADCETYDTVKLRFPDCAERRLSCHILRRPDGLELVVAHPIDFAGWIAQSFDPTPKSVRVRFCKLRKTSEPSTT